MHGARGRALAWLALAGAAAVVVVALWGVRVSSCALAVGEVSPRCSTRLAADVGSAAIWTAVAAIVLVVAARRALRELRRAHPGRLGSDG